jgi:hypothetical protein
VQPRNDFRREKLPTYMAPSADSDDPGQGFQLKAATIPIEGGQYWPVGTFMGSQRW